MIKNINDYEHEYHVIITKSGTGKATTITGKLTYLYTEIPKCSIQGNNDISLDALLCPNEKMEIITFHPLTVLGDLNKLLPNPPNISFASEIEKIINSDKCISIDDLDLLRQKYKLEINCKIYTEITNPAFDLLSKRNKHVENTVFEPLFYEFGKNNDTLLKNKYLTENHEFRYVCYTVSEIIFSILHFIVIHNYKFHTCLHCQKRYAKVLCQGQQKYCPRISPLSSRPYLTSKKIIYQKQFENMTCQEAMRFYNNLMRNMIKNKTKDIPSTDKNRNDFYNSVQEYRKTISKIASIPNLVDFFNFVRDTNLE